MAEDVRVQILIDFQGDQELQANLVEMEVYESVDSATTCRARFAIDIDGTNFTFLDDDRLQPGQDHLMTVLIVVDMVPTVISHGIITERRLEIADGGAGSAMELVSTDRRILMDRKCRGSNLGLGPAAGIVTAMLAQYGFVPQVVLFDQAVFVPLMNTLNQGISDLALIQALAGQHDAHFWIDWSLFPVEVAHFEATPSLTSLAGLTRTTLSANAGVGKSTMGRFRSQWVSEMPNATGNLWRVDIDSGKLVGGSGPSATVPRLGDKPDGPDIECQVLSAGDLAEATRRQIAALNDASWVVRAEAESSVRALGSLVRPREVVTVAGVGAVDSGDYFVDSVRHRISTTDHLMNIKLRRNAVTSGILGFGGL